MGVLSNICILVCFSVFMSAASGAKTTTKLPQALAKAPGKFKKERALNQNMTGRIVFGELAEDKQFPYVGAALIDKNDGSESICTCSLITRKFTLFAAHCVIDPIDKITFVFGSVDIFGEAAQTRFAVRIIPHPRYSLDPDVVLNDIALSKLDKSVTLNSFVKLAVLPSRKSSKSYSGVSLIAMGFGLYESGEPSQFLRYTTMRGRSDETCDRWFGPNTRNLICVRSSDASGPCPGRSSAVTLKMTFLCGCASTRRPSCSKENAWCFEAGVIGVLQMEALSSSRSRLSSEFFNRCVLFDWRGFAFVDDTKLLS